MELDGWARLLVVLAGVGWVSTVILAWSARSLREHALTERAVAGVILSTASSLFAFMALTVILDVDLPAGSFTGILVAIALLLNAPQIIWAVAALTGRFR